MALKTSCPHCRGEFHIFNYRESEFNCPLCGKKLKPRALKKERVPALKCECCGDCCRFVPELKDSDIRRLARKVRNVESFIFRKKGKAYLVLRDGRGRERKSTVRLKDCWCVFMDRDTMRCTVHQFKPDQCRQLEPGFSCLGINKPEIDFSKI